MRGEGEVEGVGWSLEGEDGEGEGEGEDVRTWDLYYGGSTVVQFVVQKKWSKHPRRF